MQKITPFLWSNNQLKRLEDKDGEKSKRVMHAMLQMHKIDIKHLKEAHDKK